ncbi:SDR family oxidoreductase [Mycobacterium sp. CVI_P3]|uniref:SDR family oxidoreductase n=1 Tax=Mycobacterium pinniadriaticum TaxID=2994102 RepID=A0ABT3SL87_9MYCO|nr:SDR family oxidoreductase [Mycobacterium pinniadriaticum]MCX2933834.1 SDR family oxidoreductase [Mycobacterium pinniadriaticum]MCX2940256.1 SDR family oxidoreductase [Mycobacterium pinniadriaticum]
MLPPPGPNRAALITGASSGIGAEIARVLSDRGHHVVLVARRTEQLTDLAEQLRRPSSVVGADLSQPAQRAQLPERVAALGLEVDILVNNAGLSTMGPVAAADPDAELTVIEVDVAAVVDLCTRFVAGMVGRRRGAVLNVASVAAFGPLPGQAVYGAAKAFVLSYTRALGEELKSSGITATALCPGPVHTGFGEAAGISTEEAEAALPKPLWVSPEDVARAAVDGLAAGDPVVVPGRLNRAATAVYHLTPRRLLLPLLARNHPGLKQK